MKSDEVEVGGIYTAKISDKVVSVRIDRENPRGGWDGTNQMTNRPVRIKTAQKLRERIGPTPALGSPPRGNDAASGGGAAKPAKASKPRDTGERVAKGAGSAKPTPKAAKEKTTPTATKTAPKPEPSKPRKASGRVSITPVPPLFNLIEIPLLSQIFIHAEVAILPAPMDEPLAGRVFFEFWHPHRSGKVGSRKLVVKRKNRV